MNISRCACGCWNRWLIPWTQLPPATSQPDGFTHAQNVLRIHNIQIVRAKCDVSPVSSRNPSKFHPIVYLGQWLDFQCYHPHILILTVITKLGVKRLNISSSLWAFKSTGRSENMVPLWYLTPGSNGLSSSSPSNMLTVVENSQRPVPVPIQILLPTCTQRVAGGDRGCTNLCTKFIEFIGKVLNLWAIHQSLVQQNGGDGGTFGRNQHAGGTILDWWPVIASIHQPNLVRNLWTWTSRVDKLRMWEA